MSESTIRIGAGIADAGALLHRASKGGWRFIRQYLAFLLLAAAAIGASGHRVSEVSHPLLYTLPLLVILLLRTAWVPWRDAIAARRGLSGDNSILLHRTAR